jgi:hypothetical protein
VDTKHLLSQRHSRQGWSLRRLKCAAGWGVHDSEAQLSEPGHREELVTEVRYIENPSQGDWAMREMKCEGAKAMSTSCHVLSGAKHPAWIGVRLVRG